MLFALPSLVPPPLVPWAAAPVAYPSIHHCDHHHYYYYHHHYHYYYYYYYYYCLYVDMHLVHKFQVIYGEIFKPAPLWNLRWPAILGAMGLGFCLSLLFFMDQNIAGALVNSSDNRYDTSLRCCSFRTHLVFYELHYSFYSFSFVLKQY